MSKALKPVSATKTAETQLEDLMQAQRCHYQSELILFACVSMSAPQ
jgi:Spy/CpxP family protein refolding chaperone